MSRSASSVSVAPTDPHRPHDSDAPASARVVSDVLAFETPAMTPSGLAAKRALDLVAGSLLMIVSLPIWIVVVVAIRLDSSGTALFRQERVGARPRREGDRLRWRQTTFTVYKFRTMAADADQSIHQTAVREYASGVSGRGDDEEAPYKLTGDPRVTRVGRALRATSLDELPQLINVLQGSMSLVGPRPLPTYEVAEYDDWHYERLCALPGITGLWQIEGRGRTSFDEGTRMDIDYVRKWSLLLDLTLLVKTVPAVLSRRGAR